MLILINYQLTTVIIGLNDSPTHFTPKFTRDLIKSYFLLSYTKSLTF
jgi:hypothetical protein